MDEDLKKIEFVEMEKVINNQIGVVAGDSVIPILTNFRVLLMILTIVSSYFVSLQVG